MIEREKLNKILDAKDLLEGICKVEITIYDSGDFRLWVTPLSHICGMTEEERHKVLAVLTPIVGKLTMTLNGMDKWFNGEANGISITVCNADKCKILGYRTETRTVKKEIPVEVTYEEVEEEVQVPITDCDIRAGKATEEQLEVSA